MWTPPPPTSFSILPVVKFNYRTKSIINIHSIRILLQYYLKDWQNKLKIMEKNTYAFYLEYHKNALPLQLIIVMDWTLAKLFTVQHNIQWNFITQWLDMLYFAYNAVTLLCKIKSSFLRISAIFWTLYESLGLPPDAVLI